MNAYELIESVARTEKWINNMLSSIQHNHERTAQLAAKVCARNVFSIFPELRGEEKIYPGYQKPEFDSRPRLVCK